MANDPKQPNQGEGDREADQRYRDDLSDFVHEGRVPRAAMDAADALDGPEADALAEAERVGKSRSRVDHDSETNRDDEPLPAWWTGEHASVWSRVKEAFHRDWLQTLADLGIKGGAKLGQTALDTLKQAAGDPMPASADAGVDWDVARKAIRQGWMRAQIPGADDRWDRQLEDELQKEWEVDGVVAWPLVAPLVRRGWEQGRKEAIVTPLH